MIDIKHLGGTKDPILIEMLTRWAPDIQTLDGDQAISLGLSFLFSTLISVAKSDKEFAQHLQKKIIRTIESYSALIVMDDKTVN